MALDYSLEIATELQPIEALRLMGDKLDLRWGDETHLVGPGIWISAIKETRSGQEIMEEAFGFRPTLSIGFRLNPNSDQYDRGKIIMPRATMLLLGRATGDAVLLFNGEHVLLQRTKQLLVLNRDWQWWNDAQLVAEITAPHEVRSISSPLL